MKSDSVDIQEALAGSEKAYSSLMSRHRQRIHRFIRGKVNDTALAEELTQDTFIDAFRYLHTFRGDSQFYTWLCTIALRRIYKVNNKPTYTEETFVTTVTPESLLVTKQSMQQVTSVWKKLHPKQQQALFLKEYENLCYDEISQLLGCSKNYAKKLVFKAKKQIRKELYDQR